MPSATTPNSGRDGLRDRRLGMRCSSRTCAVPLPLEQAKPQSYFQGGFVESALQVFGLCFWRRKFSPVAEAELPAV
jgi:hypothetical protein